MTTRAQDDFDNFVNAEWKKNNPIPDKYPRFTNFTLLSEKMEKLMIDLSKDKNNKLINRIFNLYMGQSDKDLRSVVLEEVDSEDFAKINTSQNLLDYILKQIPNGKYYLLHIYHSGTCRNPKFQVPHFNFGGLSLPDKSYYTDKVELRSSFEEMICNIFKTLDLDTKFYNSNHISKIWDIEHDISRAHYEKAEKRDPLKTYHPITLNLFHSLTNNRYSLLTKILPNEYQDIVLNNDKLPVEIIKVLDKYGIDSLKTWLLWKIVKSRVGSSTGEAYDKYFKFYGTKLSGTKVPRPIEERAVLFTKGYLEDEYSKIYIRDYADKSLTTEFPKFVAQLSSVIKDKLSKASWMSQNTKSLALDKLSKIRLKVVGPSNFENYDFFDKNYNNIYQFLDQYDKWDWDELEVKRKMYKLHDPEKWEMAAVDINAYYHPYYNEIVFPAAILQEPFYSSKYSFGENAGGIGAVICHEISHGFDDEGSKYDSDGFLHNWWSKDDRANYESVIKPMETYFNTLSYNSKQLNGRLTQGENLADLGGLKCSLAACKNDTEKLKCIEAWGKTWRANLRDEYSEQMIVVDPHSLPRFRINGILPHISDFYRLFNVIESDKMYLSPELRCKLYD